MIDLPDVNNALGAEDLFVAFKAQLIKDFESCALDVSFTEQLPRNFNDLSATLSKQIQYIGKLSGQQLWQLLYRIDLSDKQVKTQVNQHPEMSYEQCLADLIIKRVLQKVVFKKFYSK